MRSTCNAELVALETFVDTREGIVKKTDVSNFHAFKYFSLLHEPEIWFNFEETWPHMFDFSKILDQERRDFAGVIVRGLDFHQLIAYHSLRKVPHGVCFVPGGPGAGKTRWALDMATLAQLGPKKVRILYLMDMNHPVDDLASRMAQIYAHFPGGPKNLIRMRRYAPESGCRTSHLKGLVEDGPYRPDFSPSFIRLLKQMSPDSSAFCPSDSINTLDEAAWNLYRRHPEDFIPLKEIIDNFRGAWQYDQLGDVERESLADALRPLYQQALEEADFIATTPVAAAHRSFADHFEPDIIFYDEAAHARELSTLIPLAFFNAKACVFIGDHRQVTPYVAHVHKYCRQLKVTAIQRATENQKAHDQLFTTYRSYGGLHELSSVVFYDGKLVSAHVGEQLLPGPVQEVRKHLDKLRGHSALIPRLLISPQGLSPSWVKRHEWKRAESGKSSWNPAHQAWVIPQVYELLKASWFTGLDGETPGSIMIVTSLRESRNRYKKALSKLHQEKRHRVTVRTIDSSQGHQADVVFVDLVKLSQFHDDTCRLCVATTRAIQGEIIVLPRLSFSDEVKYTNLSKIHDYCKSHEQCPIDDSPDRPIHSDSE